MNKLNFKGASTHLYDLINTKVLSNKKIFKTDCKENENTDMINIDELIK